jgi:hypothetical protein
LGRAIQSFCRELSSERTWSGSSSPGSPMKSSSSALNDVPS